MPEPPVLGVWLNLKTKDRSGSGSSAAAMSPKSADCSERDQRWKMDRWLSPICQTMDRSNSFKGVQCFFDLSVCRINVPC